MLCKPLLSWYEQVRRDLPWRHTTEPYAIWVSEIMLQQTQVKTVLPRYTAWLRRFPDIATLARADEHEVLKAWEGLGYYRRARFLHAAAQHIMQQHDGIFPRDFNDILALNGIGRSTAGAISSFCYQTFTPVLDGNVKRVLKRWHGDESLKDAALWPLAQRYIEASQQPDQWNQAMMELGATVCMPRQAQCEHCPVSQNCRSAFDVATSQTTAKAKVQDVHWQVHIHTNPAQGIWLQQRPEQGIWARLWTPPIEELADKPERQADHIHILTHRRLHLYANISAQPASGEGQWFQNLEKVALPTGIHQLMKALQLQGFDSAAST